MKRSFVIAGLGALFVAASAFAQTKTKTTTSPKSTPKVEAMKKSTTNITSPEVASPSVPPATTEDPVTAAPAEPLAPMDMPPAPPMDPAPPASAREPHMIGLSAALGLPHPLRFAGHYVHSSRIFSAELGMGSASLSAGDVKIGLSNFEAALRWHPFMGSFFLGAHVGQQTLSGESSDNIQGQNVTVKLDIKTTYVTPHLGWMWGMADGGFFTSMDFGYQSPMSSSASFSSNADPAVQATEDYRNLDRDVRDQGKKIGEIGLPHYTMLRIGYLF